MGVLDLYTAAETREKYNTFKSEEDPKLLEAFLYFAFVNV